MSVGLVFGGFWTGIGILMWWWPAAIFVAFSNEDVTPGARGFAVGAILIGMAFLTLEAPGLGLLASLPATMGVVGLLQVLHPIALPGVADNGSVSPRQVGGALCLSGLVLVGLSAI